MKRRSWIMLATGALVAGFARITEAGIFRRRCAPCYCPPPQPAQQQTIAQLATRLIELRQLASNPAIPAAIRAQLLDKLANPNIPDAGLGIGLPANAVIVNGLISANSLDLVQGQLAVIRDDLRD